MISPLAYVHPSAKIGKDVEIQPFAYIEEGVEIGDGCLICSQVSILKGTKLGKNIRVYNGATLGAEPQDLRYEGKQGTLVIGDDCEIRENVLIARSLDETSVTRIGCDCALMDGAHICHSSQIGDHCILGIHTIVGSKSIVDDYAILSNAFMGKHGHYIHHVDIIGLVGCPLVLQGEEHCLLFTDASQNLSGDAVNQRSGKGIDFLMDGFGVCYVFFVGHFYVWGLV